MSADRYIEAAKEALDELRRRSRDDILAASQVLVDAIRAGKCVYSFGCSHSFMLTEEVVYRTGGLAIINPVVPHGMMLDVRPIPMTSKVERVSGLGSVYADGAGIAAGDAVIVASTSGRNPVVIDFALRARELGARVIAITSIEYTEAVTSRHPNGLKLRDVADVVVDNAAPAGDAAVAIDGFEQAVGPLSTLTGVAVMNAIVCEVVARLIAAGETPPVFVSGNLDWGDAHNRRLFVENGHRIKYL
jgi:uncharacterized phosphosugar-binding protein